MFRAITLLRLTTRLVVIVPFTALLYAPSPASASILTPDLASFAVLGAVDGVTNVATSVIGGNLGCAPSPCPVGGGYDFATFGFGSLKQNTALAQQAQLDLDTAIVSLSAFGPGITIPLGNLDAFQASQGGKIIPNTYTVPAVLPQNLLGNLVLDGGGSNSAVWVFQFPSTFITGTSSTVTVQNVGDGANVGVYWNVHSAATLNGNVFAGNVLAHDLISSDGNLTNVCGRLLSAETKVTLIKDTISIGCAAGTVTGTGGEHVAQSGGFAQGVVTGFPGSGGTVPEPSTLLLLGSGLAGLAGVSWRRHRRK